MFTCLNLSLLCPVSQLFITSRNAFLHEVIGRVPVLSHLLRMLVARLRRSRSSGDSVVVQVETESRKCPLGHLADEVKSSALAAMRHLSSLVP